MGSNVSVKAHHRNGLRPRLVPSETALDAEAVVRAVLLTVHRAGVRMRWYVAAGRGHRDRRYIARTCGGGGRGGEL